MAVDELQINHEDGYLDCHCEVNELELEWDRLEVYLDDIEAEIESMEARLADRQDHETEREELTAEIEDLRSRIEQLDAGIVEHFNDQVDELLDRLEFGNLERARIEDVHAEGGDGRYPGVENGVRHAHRPHQRRRFGVRAPHRPPLEERALGGRHRVAQAVDDRYERITSIWTPRFPPTAVVLGAGPGHPDQEGSSKRRSWPAACSRPYFRPASGGRGGNYFISNRVPLQVSTHDHSFTITSIVWTFTITNKVI